MQLSLAAAAADAAIGAYQRYVSPFKGFRCAHRVHTGRRSCSAFARGVVQRVGVLALFTALPRQFERCGAACAALCSRVQARRDRQRDDAQRRKHDCGNCDCSGCDLPCDPGGCDAGGLDCSL